MKPPRTFGTREVAGDHGRKLAFVLVVVVLLGITAFSTLRDPASEPEKGRRTPQPTGTTIRTGPPPALERGESDGKGNTSPSSTPAPGTGAAAASSTRGEREAIGAPAIARQQTHAATTAARAFLDGYLPYTHGRTDATRIRRAAKRLRRELEAAPPRVPAAVARADPRLISVRAEAATGDREVEVLAVVNDGRRRYGIPLLVRGSRGRWVVTAVNG